MEPSGPNTSSTIPRVLSWTKRNAPEFRLCLLCCETHRTRLLGKGFGLCGFEAQGAGFHEAVSGVKGFGSKVFILIGVSCIGRPQTLFACIRIN